MAVSWRKDKNDPEKFIVFGPFEEVNADSDVVVTSKNGKSQTVHVTKVSRPFSVDGEPYVYGYLD
jgi:hypothetical protein